MSDRLRIPVDDDCLIALGRFAYIFAGYEWNAADCCQRMQAGYLGKLGRKTSGVVAEDLVRLASRRPSIDHLKVAPPTDEFKRLV